MPHHHNQKDDTIMEMIGLFAFLVVPTLVVGLIMILMGEW